MLSKLSCMILCSIATTGKNPQVAIRLDEYEQTLRHQVYEIDLLHQRVCELEKQLRTSKQEELTTRLQACEKKLSTLEQEYFKELALQKKALDQIVSLLKEAPQDYIVKEGDSLSSIAQEHKLTVSQLKQLNMLKDDRIYKGQKLKVS